MVITIRSPVYPLVPFAQPDVKRSIEAAVEPPSGGVLFPPGNESSRAIFAFLTAIGQPASLVLKEASTKAER